MPELNLEEFTDKMNEVMPAVIKEFARRQAQELYRGKITLQQVFILEFLSKQDLAKMTDLARYMHVSTAASTGIVDRLVRSGYVIRVFDSDDRRIIKIKLTDKGRDLAKKVVHERRKMILGIFAKITQQEREDYLKIILRIYDVLLKEKT
jgi:DNA-binding MarR family transcriptional regulator